MPLTLALSLVLAWPVDMVHDVDAGREKFVKLAAIEWVEVEDASIATAEVMEAGEVLLSGLKPGRTLVLLYAEGRFAVWRVRVGGKSEAPGVALEAAKKACPDLKHAPAEEVKLTATVGSDACFKALAALLGADAFTARELDLTFDGKVLQTQLKAIQGALKKGLASKYVGAGLVLEGEVTPAEHRQTLWQLFKKSVGRVALDDRLTVTAPSPPVPDRPKAPAATPGDR
ncbi:MAG: pilus assembly protein N-terminal domain-containing protein [Archangiaceae bacterium]|nr:pilus assembly protein N-terminal domain-containing protein [Archangiaceae bacterium]